MNIHFQKVIFTSNTDKKYKNLPKNIKKKVDKQILFLSTNPRHPSLRFKKVQGATSFEVRIDYHYRFTFFIDENVLYILSLGPHDKGLGKK